ncbi:phosphatase PAP2 family protein [Agathobacter rectalis]|uniref:phosphatase PAP2 family protein n=1 Tax=Agathobacter rectalis TaxID=39491 RepID=UPI003FD6D864
MLALSIIVPLVGFTSVSVFRYIVNRPRPYERFDMPPVIPKDTHGRSFPSRHVFSAFIISFTVLICSPAGSPFCFIGILLTVLAAIIACVRVISGVHFISDVLGAFVFATIEAYIVTVFFI